MLTWSAVNAILLPNASATFAQGLWGPRKFVILGESGGTIPSDRAPCGLRSRLNADVVSRQCDLVAERERYPCTIFFNTASLVATKKSFFSLINTCLLQRNFVCDDLLFFVSLVPFAVQILVNCFQ